MVQITKRNKGIFLIIVALVAFLLVWVGGSRMAVTVDETGGQPAISSGTGDGVPPTDDSSIEPISVVHGTTSYPTVDLTDESLHWENLYEVDWTTDEERLQEIDAQWELAAEWGYTKPTDSQALLDTLLASGVLTGTDVPRPLSEIEEILPPRYEQEVAVLVGSAGVTSLQQDDAGNWIYVPLASDVGHVVNGTVAQGEVLFSGNTGLYQVVEGAEPPFQEWFAEGAVFDSFYQQESDTFYLATNQGVYQGDDAAWERISGEAIFGWSLAQAADGSLWVGGEKMIRPAPAITIDEVSGRMLVAGQPTTTEQHLTAVTHGAVWHFVDGIWSEVVEFPADPIIREIVVGTVDGREHVYARGHEALYRRGESGLWETLLDEPVSSLLITEDTLYVGTEDSRLLLMRNGQTTAYTLDSTFGQLELMHLYLPPNEGGMLVATRAGVLTIDLATGETGHTGQGSAQTVRNRLGKPATQRPDIHWCPVNQYSANNYVWYEMGETARGVTNIEFHHTLYTSNHLRLYPNHQAVGSARMVMWYCNGNSPQARSWKGCNGADDCHDARILSDHLNSNGDEVGGGVSCDHNYQAVIWSEWPGYQPAIGRTVGKQGLGGVNTHNGRRYYSAVEMVASDFGDMRAEQESSFRTTNVYFRQHVQAGSNERARHVRSGEWSGEQVPKYEDGNDDGLQVYANGAWRNPETVSLYAGQRYQFRVRVYANGVNNYWPSQGFVRVYADWNGNEPGTTTVHSTDHGSNNGFRTFYATMPNNGIAHPWFRLTLSQERPAGIEDIWDGVKNTPIMGEIEDYRLTVTTAADMSITKRDTADPVFLNDIINYDLTVTNHGPNSGQNVQVVDTIPAGTSYVSAAGSGFACSRSGNRVTCTRSAMGVGESRTIRVRLRADNANYALVTNQAAVSISNTDINSGNNRASETTTIRQQADVTVAKSDSADPVFVGETFRYDVVVRNNGPHTAQNVTVVDDLPVGVNFSSVNGQGFSCHRTGRRLTCTRSTLTLNESRTIQIYVTADPSYTGTGVNNVVSVSTSTLETNTSNNNDSEPTSLIPATDLSIVKTDIQDPVTVGDTIEWRIVAQNHGPLPAETVVVMDMIPAGLAYNRHVITLSDGAINWSCSVVGQAWRCATPLMPVGQVATINLYADVPADYTGTETTNTAEISSVTTETTTTNNSSNETTAIGQLVDLVVTKDDNIDPVVANDLLIWSIEVSNKGPGVARQVTLQDALPATMTAADVSFVSTSGWVCDAGTLTCQLNSDLPPGGYAPLIQISTVITDGYGDYLENHVSVAAVEPERNPADNEDGETTTIGQFRKTIPPTGYIFLHARFDDDLRLTETEAPLEERDYTASDVIVNQLQVPLQVGLGFEVEEAAVLCLSNIDPCPFSKRIAGVTEVVSYTISSFEAISPTVGSPLERIGSQTVSLNRYAVENEGLCPSRCVGFNRHLLPHYEWANTEYLILVHTTKGGRQIECTDCLRLVEAEPGYYRLRGQIVLQVTYSGYAEQTQRFLVDGEFIFELIAPFVNDRTE